jgi:hypothetical protein
MDYQQYGFRQTSFRQRASRTQLPDRGSRSSYDSLDSYNKVSRTASSTKPAELAEHQTGSTGRTKMVENKTQTHNPNQKRIQPIAITKDNDKVKETVGGR